jgi:ERCC4-type nuclease
MSFRNSYRSRTKTTGGGMGRPRTAVCSDNQGKVDLLIAQRDEQVLLGNPHYRFTLHKAVKALAQCPTPITNVREAMQLPGIGPHLAHIICGVSGATSTTKSSSKKTPSATTATLTRDESTTSASNVATDAETTATTTAKPKARAKRKLKAPPASSASDIPSSSSTAAASTATATTNIPPVISGEKERAYQQALAAAESYKDQQLEWTVILLIDTRERKSAHVVAKCQMSGIPCEARQLPISDMMWIARGHAKNSGSREQVQVELLLGTVVERKTVADLTASLFGTRYEEQQRRMIEAGIPQALFIIEGNVETEYHNIHPEVLHSTLWHIRLHKGLQVLQTRHLDDTVQTLKRMHRRILQRSFPQAFSHEALPDFVRGTEPYVRLATDPHRALELRRRRQRRIQSLLDMRFDTHPEPWTQTHTTTTSQRLLTYAELKARVERDREMDQRSIGGIHAAMLKQVPTLSNQRVAAVCQAYPTPAALLQAYDDYHARHPYDDARLMLARLPVEEENGKRACYVGPRASAELYVAYGMRGSNDGNNSSSPSPVATMARSKATAPSPTSDSSSRNPYRQPSPEAMDASNGAAISKYYTRATSLPDGYQSDTSSIVVLSSQNSIDKRDCATRNESSQDVAAKKKRSASNLTTRKKKARIPNTSDTSPSTDVTTTSSLRDTAKSRSALATLPTHKNVVAPQTLSKETPVTKQYDMQAATKSNTWSLSRTGSLLSLPSSPSSSQTDSGIAPLVKDAAISCNTTTTTARKQNDSDSESFSLSIKCHPKQAAASQPTDVVCLYDSNSSEEHEDTDPPTSVNIMPRDHSYGPGVYSQTSALDMSSSSSSSDEDEDASVQVMTVKPTLRRTREIQSQDNSCTMQRESGSTCSLSSTSIARPKKSSTVLHAIKEYRLHNSQETCIELSSDDDEDEKKTNETSLAIHQRHTPTSVTAVEKSAAAIPAPSTPSARSIRDNITNTMDDSVDVSSGDECLFYRPLYKK